MVWLAWMGLCCVLAVARKNGGHFIDPSQELIALGIVNLFSSVLYGFPVTGEQWRMSFQPVGPLVLTTQVQIVTASVALVLVVAVV